MKDYPVARSATRSPSRREFFRGSSALTLGAAATGLVGCGEAGDSTTIEETTDGEKDG